MLLTVPHGEDPRTPAFELFQKLVNFAVPRGADRLEIVTDSDKASFASRVDGIRYPTEAPDPALCVQLIDYLKEHAGMDLSDRRRKQQGKMYVEVDGHGRHDLDLTTAGSTRGLQLIIDVDADGRCDMELDDLGLLPGQMQALEGLLSELSGVVLFSSPPKQGTTTTMYAMLKRHDPYTSSVMTFEEETVFDVEGVNHNTCSAMGGEQGQAQFGALLRADPNVMMVSKLASKHMAKTVMDYAEDTRVYAPLPAKDTMAGLKLWMKLAGDKRVAAETLSAIVSQRLIRKLCTVCRAPYQPDATALKKLNIPAGGAKQLYKASGKVVVKDEQIDCPTCQGLGYRGRVGFFEIMTVDSEARSLIASGEGDRLVTHLRKNRMVVLQEAALAKVLQGVCDIKEVTRVMSESQKG